MVAKAFHAKAVRAYRVVAKAFHAKAVQLLSLFTLKLCERIG